MTTMNDSAIAAVAWEAGFRGNALITAVAVALAESGGNMDAVNHNTNGSTDYGLWQINTIHRARFPGILTPSGDWHSGKTNARMAYVISSGGRNWSPWTTYKTGSYARFVGRARAAAKGTSSASPTAPPTSPGAGSGAASAAYSSGGLSLTDGSTWLRVAMFIGGLALITFGVLALASNQVPAVKTLRKVIA